VGQPQQVIFSGSELRLDPAGRLTDSEVIYGLIRDVDGFLDNSNCYCFVYMFGLGLVKT
jgi:hypothetical protein